MKFRFQEYRRRVIIPLIGLGLAAYYLFVFLPLGRRAERLDVPLQKAWEKLATSLNPGQTNATAIDFMRLTNQIHETRQALAVLDTAKKQAIARLRMDPALRDRMSGPFQLFEYQNELSKELDELNSLAKTRKVTLEPAVLAGFPEHTAEIRQPGLLWPALADIDALLRTAFECNITTIHSLESPLGLTNAPPTNSLERLTEIPLEIEFTASATNVTRFLRCLPLRPEEIRAEGLLKAPPDKPVLFVDRLVVRKQSPEKPDEVRVALRAIGFVLRD